MAGITTAQAQAIVQIARAITDTVREAGPMGAPAGVIYAAMMAHGCSKSQFDTFMACLERAGAVRRQGDLYFAGEAA